MAAEHPNRDQLEAEVRRLRRQLRRTQRALDELEHGDPRDRSTGALLRARIRPSLAVGAVLSAAALTISPADAFGGKGDTPHPPTVVTPTAAATATPSPHPTTTPSPAAPSLPFTLSIAATQPPVVVLVEAPHDTGGNHVGYYITLGTGVILALSGAASTILDAFRRRRRGDDTPERPGEA